ncbi:MAG: pyrimidine 5'-nucleotidase [Caldiserica bacterium]|nr:pyrimidine 5'-nucleotidase [Caldisericota bacterium]
MKTLLLDCDQTLYSNLEFISAIRERMVLYMVKVLGRPVEEMVDLRKRYLKAYGTTLSGLMRHQDIDPYDYMNFVHDVDAALFLKQDVKLREMLLSLGVHVYVLSNAPINHIKKVLALLGILDIPERIFSIEDFDFHGKPNRSCFEKVCAELGVQPEECWLVDDDDQNLEGAAQFGMHTCLVGSQEDGCFDLKIDNIHQLEKHISKIRE